MSAVTSLRDASSSGDASAQRSLESNRRDLENVGFALMDASTLLKIMGGNRALMREMARLCLEEDGPRLRTELRAAAGIGDLSGVRDAAHALKGLVAEFRAATAREAAGAIEDAVSCADPFALSAAVEDFEREYEKLAAVLRSFLEEPTS